MQLTAFHDPKTASNVLVSVCGDDEQRTLVTVRRDSCSVVSHDHRLWAPSSFPFEPAHGQVMNGLRYYPLVPAWRVHVPGLPLSTPPDWLRCVLLFSWRHLAAIFWRDSLLMYDSTDQAIDALLTSVRCDILFACSPETLSALDQRRQQIGSLQFLRRIPVVCMPDEFARVTSLDRDQWYRAPFLFDPDPCLLSEHRRREYCQYLAEHRHRWIEERGIVRMMFALSRITELQLHEVSRPHQTLLADALIERVWRAHATELPALTVVPAAEIEEGKFKGASVLPACCGVHRGNLRMPDVSSLYPNVVREYLSDKYPLYARLFAMMIEWRTTETSADHAGGIKVVTNSVFGSRKFGRYHDVALAELITESGRRVQSESLQLLASQLGTRVRVLGGDTDALILDVDASISDEQLVTVLNGERKFTLYKPTVDAFTALFIVNNKSWAGLRADGSIVTRGLAPNRSKVPPFVVDSHREWIRRILTDKPFARNFQQQQDWIRERAAWLHEQCWSLEQLAICPRPTQQHPEVDRAYLIVKHSREHVPLAQYARLSARRPAVDVDYLISVYFTDEVHRQSRALTINVSQYAAWTANNRMQVR